MAMTVTDYSGLGPGLTNLANIFTNQQGSAVDADLKRQQRAGIVADTALKTQQHSILGDAMTRQGVLTERMLDPAWADTPEGRAFITSQGMTLNPNTGAISGVDPNFLFGTSEFVQPGQRTPQELSTIGYATGGPNANWANTPIGQQAAIDAALTERDMMGMNAMDVARLNAASGLQTEMFKTLMPGAGGKKYTASASDLGALDVMLDNYFAANFPGMYIDEQTKSQAFEAAAARLQQTGEITTAVQDALTGVPTEEYNASDMGNWFRGQGVRFPVPPATGGGGQAIPQQQQLDTVLQMIGIDPDKMRQLGIDPGALTGAEPQRATGKTGAPEEGVVGQSSDAAKYNPKYAPPPINTRDGKMFATGPGGETPVAEGTLWEPQVSGFPTFKVENGKWVEIEEEEA